MNTHHCFFHPLLLVFFPLGRNAFLHPQFFMFFLKHMFLLFTWCFFQMCYPNIIIYWNTPTHYFHFFYPNHEQLIQQFVIAHVLQNQSQFGTPPAYPIDVFCLLWLMQLITILNLPLKIIIFICMSYWVSTKSIYIQMFGPRTMHNLETKILQHVDPPPSPSICIW